MDLVYLNRILGTHQHLVHVQYQILLLNAGYGKVATEIKPIKKFYKAEKYHQDYIKKNPNGYCPDHSTGIKFITVDPQDAPNNAIISIPTTSPLRSSLDLENCLDEFEKYKPDAVVTVTDAHRNPYFNMVEKKPNGEVSLVLDNKGGINRRQDAPIMFDMTTVAYVLDVKFIMNHNHLFEGRIRSVYIPIERSIDIDIDLDFKIAELIIDSGKKNAAK